MKIKITVDDSNLRELIIAINKYYNIGDITLPNSLIEYLDKEYNLIEEINKNLENHLKFPQNP